MMMVMMMIVIMIVMIMDDDDADSYISNLIAAFIVELHAHCMF
jgi:hypothetical protein